MKRLDCETRSTSAYHGSSSSNERCLSYNVYFDTELFNRDHHINIFTTITKHLYVLVEFGESMLKSSYARGLRNHGRNDRKVKKHY